MKVNNAEWDEAGQGESLYSQVWVFTIRHQVPTSNNEGAQDFIIISENSFFVKVYNFMLLFTEGTVLPCQFFWRKKRFLPFERRMPCITYVMLEVQDFIGFMT